MQTKPEIHTLFEISPSTIPFPHSIPICGGNLPLHKACPIYIVKTLIAAWPELFEPKSDNGMLPLHMTFVYHTSYSVICIILQSFPDNTNVK